MSSHLSISHAQGVSVTGPTITHLTQGTLQIVDSHLPGPSGKEEQLVQFETLPFLPKVPLEIATP